MKKAITILLCAVMLISMIGCTGGKAKTYTVGFGRTDYTPDFPVEMAGFGNTMDRVSTGYLDPVYVTAIAFTDAQDNTAILLTADYLKSDMTITNSIRKAVTDETGIPEGNVMFAATHCHSTPNQDNPLIQRRVIDGAVAAVKEALADRTEAEIYIGTAKTEGLNFVRHYVQEAGTTVGDNYGSASSSPIVGHTTEVDNSAQLIRFVREGSKDIVLMNFQSHPTMTGGAAKTNISADFIGYCRLILEEKLDCDFAYFTGASGNVNPSSRIEEENIYGKDYKDHGKALADYAMETLESGMEKVDGGEVKILTQTYVGQAAHDDGDLLQYCSLIEKAYQEGGAGNAMKVGAEYGIHSVFHARAIQSRANVGDTISMDLSTISFGDLSFVIAPYEMFDTNGMFIKANTPYKMSFIVTCANAHFSYIASEQAFDYGCYEVDMRKFARGTAEDLANTYISMLTQMKTGA